MQKSWSLVIVFAWAALASNRAGAFELLDDPQLRPALRGRPIFSCMLPATPRGAATVLDEALADIPGFLADYRESLLASFDVDARSIRFSGTVAQFNVDIPTHPRFYGVFSSETIGNPTSRKPAIVYNSRPCLGRRINVDTSRSDLPIRSQVVREVIDFCVTPQPDGNVRVDISGAVRPGGVLALSVNDILSGLADQGSDICQVLHARFNAHTAVPVASAPAAAPASPPAPTQLAGSPDAGMSPAR